MTTATSVRGVQQGGTLAEEGGALAEDLDLDPCGVPCLDGSRFPGLASDAVLATVQRVEAPKPEDALVWGIANGRRVLFCVGEATAREFQAAIDAGEEPTAIVESGQLVAMDLDLA